MQNNIEKILTNQVISYLQPSSNSTYYSKHYIVKFLNSIREKPHRGENLRCGFFGVICSVVFNPNQLLFRGRMNRLPCRGFFCLCIRAGQIRTF